MLIVQQIITDKRLIAFFKVTYVCFDWDIKAYSLIRWFHLWTDAPLHLCQIISNNLYVAVFSAHPATDVWDLSWDGGQCLMACCMLVHVGCVAQLVERRSLTGELSLSCARPAADVWPFMWVNRPLSVGQPGWLSLSSFRVDKWEVGCS